MTETGASESHANVRANDKGYYREARSWEASRVLMVERSARRAWWIAGVSVAVAATSVVGISLLAPLKSVAPFLVYVDRFSGDVQVREAMDAQVQFSSVIDKHWLLQYVTSRERYYWHLLRYDYERTRALSDKGPWQSYSQQFNGPDALYKKMGQMQEYDVRIISISVLPHRQGTPGVATVRFEKTLRSADSDADGKSARYIATIAYGYRPSSLTSERALIANPLGFTVTDYRVDPELTEEPSSNRPQNGSSAAVPATAAAASGGAQ